MLLAINTATSFTSIALLDDKKLISEKSWKSANDEAEKLMPAIDEIVSDYSSIKKILVIKGPGSFTGLRVGVTVANTLANLTEAKLHAITTFEFYESAEPDADAVILYAGARGVFLKSSDQEPQNINIDDLTKATASFQKITGDISEEQAKLVPAFQKPKESFGEIVARIPIENPETLIKPYYIKKPSITLSKKKLTD